MRYLLRMKTQSMLRKKMDKHEYTTGRATPIPRYLAVFTSSSAGAADSLLGNDFTWGFSVSKLQDEISG